MVGGEIGDGNKREWEVKEVVDGEWGGERREQDGMKLVVGSGSRERCEREEGG